MVFADETDVEFAVGEKEVAVIFLWFLLVIVGLADLQETRNR